MLAAWKTLYVKSNSLTIDLSDEKKLARPLKKLYRSYIVLNSWPEEVF